MLGVENPRKEALLSFSALESDPQEEEKVKAVHRKPELHRRMEDALGKPGFSMSLPQSFSRGN